MAIRQEYLENEAKPALTALAQIWLLGSCFVSMCLSTARAKSAEGISNDIREQKLSPPQSKRFSGDPPLPVAWLTPATSHRVIFCTMKKVLLADEDASVRQMVARVLQVAGYLPLLAASPQEAVLAFQDGMPDLVVLDLTSPDDEGWQAFEQMRQIDALVPVILITSRPNQADQAMRRGITTLMEKPLDLTQLLHMIAFLLDESEKQVTGRITRPSSIHQPVSSS